MHLFQMQLEVLGVTYSTWVTACIVLDGKLTEYILVLHRFIWEIREWCQGGRHNLEETEGKNWPDNI